MRRVLAHDGDAVLLERATGTKSLALITKCGDDDKASRVLYTVAARLHAPRASPFSGTCAPTRWFDALASVAQSESGVLRLASTTAQDLLSAPQDIAVLHGDIHHGNILDFGARGWLAIDPKGLSGERGFDFAYLLQSGF